MECSGQFNLNKFVMALGATVTLLGLFVLVGWHTHTVTLIQVHPTLAPMQYNTALAFFLSGLGIISLSQKWRAPSLICGEVITLIAVLTLFQTIFGVDLGIDEAFVEDYLADDVAHPGRMAVITATCFAISGAVTAALFTDFVGSHPRFVGLSGLAVCALGLGTFWGYLNWNDAPYVWKHDSYMAVHTAVGFILVGSALSFHAVRTALDIGLTPTRWAPIAVGVTLGTLGFGLWQALLLQQNKNIEQLLEVEAVEQRVKLKELIVSRVREFVRMAKRWEASGGPREDSWRSDAQLYLTHEPGNTAVKWVDSAFQVRWVEPPERQPLALSDPNLRKDEQRRVTLAMARDLRRPIFWEPLDPAGNVKSIELYLPLFLGDNTFDGVLVATFDNTALFDVIFKYKKNSRIAITVYIDGKVVYGQPTPNDDSLTEWRKRQELGLYSSTFAVEVVPTREFLEASRSILPEVVFGVALFLSLLLALTVLFAQKVHEILFSERAVTARLTREMKERRQAEARFMRSFVHSAIGMALVAPDGRFIRVNRALCQLVGYSEEELMSMDFQSITHREDLDADMQLVNEVLAGSRDNYHLEKRYIHKSGRTVWILLSVSLVRDQANNPVHFVAQIQDITARKQAEGQRQTIQRELVTLSRQAGMAEVATGVLHNVGNLLNSINVGVTLAMEKISRSRVANLARSAQLLRANDGDLAWFLTKDPKGSQLPIYLVALADHLEGEQQELRRTLQSVTENIEHIKQIVARQQVYANGTGLVEPIVLTEIVDDALSMAISNNQKIETIREYDQLPPIMSDRHKLLQILANVARNAKDAFDGWPTKNKRLIVRIQRLDGSAKIEMQDNGKGIAPADLTRVFEYGFTTKDDGHGFGLHASAIAAQELGGSLSCNSDGHGSGATFTLELPIDSAVKAA